MLVLVLALTQIETEQIEKREMGMYMKGWPEHQGGKRYEQEQRKRVRKNALGQAVANSEVS